jgi:hypothetical protein
MQANDSRCVVYLVNPSRVDRLRHLATALGLAAIALMLQSGLQWLVLHLPDGGRQHPLLLWVVTAAVLLMLWWWRAARLYPRHGSPSTASRARLAWTDQGLLSVLPAGANDWQTVERVCLSPVSSPDHGPRGLDPVLSLRVGRRWLPVWADGLAAPLATDLRRVLSARQRRGVAND